MRFFLLFILLVTSCAQPEPVDVPPLVAHRGASRLAPENTLAAFTLAWELGADAIEADFRQSADGHIVCHHDTGTKRTAGVDRPVSDQTLQTLRRHDVGTWKHDKWAGERIPTLEEVLDTVPPNKVVVIESKGGSEIVPGLLEVMRASGLELDQMVVIAFDADVIELIEQRMPETRTWWLADFEDDGSGRWEPTVSAIIETAVAIGTDGVDLNANPDVLDDRFVHALREAGLELHVWTVNDPKLARRMIRLGVDSITTDRPGWLREQLESAPP